ncbi:MAG: HAMP domain-containing histidine kinase [Bacteroidetes bacterium]|nr:HAMP domain-containing histidine kinase [Bacteroidota bacterium]
MLRKLKRLLTLDFEVPSGGPGGKSESILVEKGNQLHELLIFTIAIYSAVFSVLNYLNDSGIEALISFSGVPCSIIAYTLYKIGYVKASKFWNLSYITGIISLLTLVSSPASGILAFFFPIIVGTLIAFQGKEIKYGYYLTAVLIIIITFLVTTDIRISPRLFTEEGLRQEWILNFVGAATATLLELTFIMLLSDKIQRKLMENSVVLFNKNEELSKANSELDNFVYRVSHDLRSPLLSVKGLLSLAHREENLPASVEEYLKMADHSIDRLDNTIKEILEYSRNSRLAIKLEPFNLRTLIENNYNDLRHLVDSRFSFQINFRCKEEIVSDSYRINTVLRNILGNAVKYRRTDINDPFIEVRVIETNRFYQIDVEDNGEGISEANQSKVFDMFYRGTKTGEGTGLGLYICREIMTKLGGKISLQSEPGKGTQVTIKIPIHHD